MDTETAYEGDAGFTGFRSRPDALTLPQGVCALAENMRFLRGRAEVRRGIKRLAEDVSPESSPLVVPVALAEDVAVTSISRSGTTATVTTVAAHGYASGDQVNVSGAVQTAYNGDVTITVTGTKTFTYNVAGAPATPATGTILANRGPVVRDAYTGGIFGACVFSSPASDVTGNGDEWVILFGSDKAWLWRDGESALVKTYPAGETIEVEDELAVVQAFDRVFLFRGRALTGDFARVACTITSEAGTATVTAMGHPFVTGDRVAVEGAMEAAYNIEADVTKTGPNRFTFAVSHNPASPATGTITCRRVKKPLMWDGGAGNFVAAGGGSNAAGATFSTLRSAGVVCYSNNQLIVAPTPVKDTVLVSDVLDYNTYDPVFKSFRANAGSDDYIVALHPFAEGDILVLGRKSIYRAHVVIASDGVSIDGAESYIELITNEVGCRAAGTVVTAGAYVYFLSDAGVYRLDSNYQDLKVRGMTVPLSFHIADQFGNINEDAVHLSSGIWFDNRYWLTVPTGSDDAPNTLLVWSALNDEWESVDRFPAGIHTLLVSDYNQRRRLFGVSRAGNLFLMEEREDGDDPADPMVTETLDIPGRIVTRLYGGAGLVPKRWLRLLSGVSLPAGSSVNFAVVGLDPDVELAAGSLENTGTVAEEYAAKYSLRVRSSNLQVEVASAGPGRPVVRGVQVQVVNWEPGAATRTEE